MWSQWHLSGAYSCNSERTKNTLQGKGLSRNCGITFSLEEFGIVGVLNSAGLVGWSRVWTCGNFSVAIFSHTVSVMNVRLCTVVLLAPICSFEFTGIDPISRSQVLTSYVLTQLGGKSAWLCITLTRSWLYHCFIIWWVYYYFTISLALKEESLTFSWFDKAETLPFSNTTFQDSNLALGPVTLGVV